MDDLTRRIYDCLRADRITDSTKIVARGWANGATTEDTIEALVYLQDKNYIRRVNLQHGDIGYVQGGYPNVPR